MTQAFAAQAPNAATDGRIDPQIRSFLAELNKDSSGIRGALTQAPVATQKP